MSFRDETMFRSSQDLINHQLDKEALGAVAWSWSDRIAAAVMRKKVDSPKPVISGTVHAAGELVAVVHLLNEVSRQRCKCRDVWEEIHAGIKDEDGNYVEWENLAENHTCIAWSAKALLETLRGE